MFYTSSVFIFKSQQAFELSYTSVKVTININIILLMRYNLLFQYLEECEGRILFLSKYYKHIYFSKLFKKLLFLYLYLIIQIVIYFITLKSEIYLYLYKLVK